MSAPITRCGRSPGKVILKNYQVCRSVTALTPRSVQREPCNHPSQQFIRLIRLSSNGYHTRTFCTSPHTPPVDNSTQVKEKSVESNITTTEDEPEPDTLYKTIHLEIKSAEVAVLKSYLQFMQMTASELEVHIENIEMPNKKTTDFNRLTLLKSAFVHKKHRVQYEIRTHFAQVTLKRLTGSTASVFLEYIQRNLPEGVAMKVTKLARQNLYPIHVGRSFFQHEVRRIPEHLKPPE